MLASRFLLPACLCFAIAGCTTEDSGSGSTAGFSNCFKREVSEQLRYCLAPVAEEDDFYRVQGRHQIIYGRYNEAPSMTKDGVSHCMTGQESQSMVNACTPDEVLELASEMLPPADASSCEATIDPRKTLSGC